MLEGEQAYIERAKKGDAACFGHLYNHYLTPIYRFIAVKVGTKQEAEDLSHEVFMSAWQKLPQYEAQGFPFSSWLYRIARNRVIDHYRTKKSHVSIDDEQMDHEELFGVQSEVADTLDTGLDLAVIKEAMSSLTGEQREVIQLRFMSDLSPAEIAKVLGKREGAVRIIQHRALLKIKSIIGEKE
jgi:RNA polymerase sigma-70 factor (ECF subfamily)